MSLDEQHHALISAFSKPYGQKEGPQVFEIKFNSENTLDQWKQIAHTNAEKLDIPIKTKQDGKTLHIALLEGDHYPRLLNAMKPELDKFLRNANEYMKELRNMYEEHKDLHQTSGDDYSHYDL